MWQVILPGVFSLLGVSVGIGLTYLIERRRSKARDKDQREILRRLILTEVEVNLVRLKEYNQLTGEITRHYQKEVYHEMLSQIGLFHRDQITQIMDFYHSLMHIEYLLEVGRVKITARPEVIVRDELPKEKVRAEEFGQRLATALKGSVDQ